MLKIITWLLILSLVFISCTNDKESYHKVKLKEDKNGLIIFETYKYKKPIGTFHLYMKTDYALRIKPVKKYLFDKLKNKWTVEYNVYDSNNKTKYVSNNLSALEEIIQNEIPNDIKIYRYETSDTWIPNYNYNETEKIIEDICKSKNIEYMGCMGDLPEWKEMAEDYVNTYWCIRCITFIP
jgi:hypothetical protein